MRKRMICGALAAIALAMPAAAAEPEETPICTDRPTKANAVCTVPVGKWQLESSAASWSRTEAGDAESKVTTLGSSVVKFGLSNRSDFQVGITPLVRVESEVAGVTTRHSGFGDLTLRYKHRLTADNAPVQVAAIPFVKLPTADGDIGNGKVEGGLAVPISISTGGAATVVLGPELDILADADGSGRHAALVNLVNVAGPIAPGVTLVGEIWTMTNFDPADTVTLASADAALAWLVSDRVQLDIGANFGLTRSTADLELYAGASVRF
jgi:hypothetical protein